LPSCEERRYCRPDVGDYRIRSSRERKAMPGRTQKQRWELRSSSLTPTTGELADSARSKKKVRNTGGRRKERKSTNTRKRD